MVKIKVQKSVSETQSKNFSRKTGVVKKPKEAKRAQTQNVQRRGSQQINRPKTSDR